MKTIHLIRHAKSSWEDDSLSDIDRPLNQRGIKSCQIMAPQLLKVGCDFQRIYCSPARRAQQTIELIALNVSPTITWHTDNELYTFSANELLRWLQKLGNDLNEVTVVGHNPAMTELNNRLTGSPLDNLPTCSYLQLNSDINDWVDLAPAGAIQVAFLSPKQFRS